MAQGAAGRWRGRSLGGKLRAVLHGHAVESDHEPRAAIILGQQVRDRGKHGTGSALPDRFESRPGDSCYVYYATETSIRYYAPRFGLDTTCIMGVTSREDRGRYVEDLQRIPKSRRVWVFFSHVYRDGHPLDERVFFLSELDRMGRR